MLSETKKILCATDGSHSADKAVAYAVDMASKLGAGLSFATVNAVSALELAEEPMFWDSTLADQADEQLHKPLQLAEASASKAKIATIKCVILHGRDIAGNIVKYAADHGYDHVVVGSQGRSGVSRILLGSVAEAVVRHAHCPVTVVR